MQTRSSDENSVRPSVKRVNCGKTKEKSVKIFIPYERTFTLVFWEEEWLVGRPLLPEILGQPAPVAITPSEKSSINTNRKSTTRFPMSLRWLSYVAPNSPKGRLKTQNRRFRSKIGLILKKVCYKVYLCEKCQRQSCRAFIGLTIHAEMIDGGRPLVPEIWVKLTALERNRRFSIYFSP